MADFDAIVVGSGCAGAVAAYELAKAGKSTLVVERGNFAGAKNMTGGRIYSHSLKKVFPDFESEAPLERKITHERIALMDPASQTAIDFTSPELAEEGKDSYSVLRAPFDQWLASKAEDAGAEYICGIAVEELLKDEGGRVVGVRAGEVAALDHQHALARRGRRVGRHGACAPRAHDDNVEIGLSHVPLLSLSLFSFPIR